MKWLVRLYITLPLFLFFFKLDFYNRNYHTLAEMSYQERLTIATQSFELTFLTQNNSTSYKINCNFGQRTSKRFINSLPSNVNFRHWLFNVLLSLSGQTLLNTILPFSCFSPRPNKPCQLCCSIISYHITSSYLSGWHVAMFTVNYFDLLNLGICHVGKLMLYYISYIITYICHVVLLTLH